MEGGCGEGWIFFSRTLAGNLKLTKSEWEKWELPSVPVFSKEKLTRGSFEESEKGDEAQNKQTREGGRENVRFA